jgi:glyoxylase-like metal-dependent hydrolase (beta-lactamase superfamily II)
MSAVYSFTFNPFYENTYIIAGDNKDCWIIDPGCYMAEERNQIVRFIEEKQLKPVKLINTHCHLDHIFGNSFIAKTYSLQPSWHRKEDVIMKGAPLAAMMFGVKAPEYVSPGEHLVENTEMELDGEVFRLLLTPGHSPGSICFYNQAKSYVIAGDVLFKGSIGRTDLPGGDYDTLIQSIHTQLMVLPDETIVYNGHGPVTTIGEERRHNPFL